MQRIFIAALAALTLILTVPAVAAAQYHVPYFYPTSQPSPPPPLAGLEDHPFGFGANWATGSALEEDFVDYVAWHAIENDYRLRAGAFSDSVYYTQSGLIGTAYSAPALNGVDWQARIIRYIPPAAERIGHYCVYDGFVNGPVQSWPLNVFTQTSVSCDTYAGSSDGR